jgi:signal transduction histidine kinase/CheY-like chemotaxis protein
LETLTDLLATAINNTKLYQESEEKAYRLELTHQINRAISSTLDLKSIFNLVANELNQVMEYDRISLNFWCPEELLFRVKMSFCSDAHLSPGDHKNIPADDTNMYDVVQSGKPYYQAKLVLEPDSKPMDRLIFSEGIRSYILLPVIDKQKVVAILSMESKKEHGFGVDQMELVELVVSHLSVAIQNARLFSDLQKAYLNLKNTQNHMIQIERFRAVGEMASGVVHDFNNILTSILGRVQMILMNLKKEEMNLSGELGKSLQVIEKSATDGAKILSRIHEFTKAKPDTAFRPIDLNLVVKDSLELTRSYWSTGSFGKDRTFPSGIQIEVKEELKAKGEVQGDAAELREVLTNLILNAVDAMPKGGCLTLKTEEDKESIFLTVEDTGVGMTEEVKSKIFIPFFTTKGDKGTGLGLSLAHGIITRHRGEIMVKSNPGLGSSFTIKLPRYDLMEEKQTPVGFKSEGAHVLVVEDEKNVRELLDEILSTAGHRVTQAKSGEEGIELFRKHKPDIVITDLGMSGLSGWDVAEKIKASDPLTPVILSTGWGVKLDQIEEHKQNIDRIISKPFKMEQILNLVSELLARRKTESVNA